MLSMTDVSVTRAVALPLNSPAPLPLEDTTSRHEPAKPAPAVNVYNRLRPWNAAFGVLAALASLLAAHDVATHNRFLWYPAALRPWAVPLLCTFATFFCGGAVLLDIILRSQGKMLLVPLTATPRHMFEQIASAMFDLMVLLPAALWAATTLLGPHALMRPEPETTVWSLARLLVGLPLAILVGFCWRALAHYVLHRPMFYARFHKRHHLLINRMTPYSAFLDTTLEFVAMEVVGGFLLPLFLVPAPAWAITLVWTLHVGSGLLDHSNTYVKDSMLFDSIYHSDHHKLSVWNFAELEIIDRWAGTLAPAAKSFGAKIHGPSE